MVGSERTGFDEGDFAVGAADEHVLCPVKPCSCEPGRDRAHGEGEVNDLRGKRQCKSVTRLGTASVVRFVKTLQLQCKQAGKRVRQRSLS